MGQKRIGWARIKKLVNENTNQMNNPRERVTALDGTKAVTLAEGMTYVLAGDPGSERNLTLPTVAAGARVRIVVSTKADTAGWKIIAPDSGVLKGGCLGANTATDATAAFNSNNTSHVALQLRADTHPGSYVDAICDGSNWIIASGIVVYTSNAPNWV